MLEESEMAASNKKNGNGRTILGPYKNYYFKDHDPVLDQMDDIRRLAGDGKLLEASKVAADTGLSLATVNNWRKRKVKRPQYASVAAMVYGLGGNLRMEYRGKQIGRASGQSKPK
jgi:hypothetical protein